MSNELQKLINIIESGGGIDRFSSRAEREIFRQQVQKIKERMEECQYLDDMKPEEDDEDELEVTFVSE